MLSPRLRTGALVLVLVLLLADGSSWARNPIRRTFFDTYPVAAGTQLDNLPSNAGHCGVCHFDFDGGGARNPYGLGVEVGLNGGLTNSQAILAVESVDSDADGFSNLVEVTSVVFGNTPTFPGLTQSNKNNVVNIPVAEIEPYLTPSGGGDTTPPDVVVSSPNGGEILSAGSYRAVSFTATDASGISHVNVYLSDDGGATFKPVAKDEPPGTGFSWFVPNRPGVVNRIRVEAYDNAGNAGHDDSDADFTIEGTPAGYVPTTLRDIDLSGTQPHEGAILDDPDVNCGSCHGDYNASVEPWYNWRGSMMSQAARDPFFFACLAVAEQDAPSVGDVCIRCHSPGGWQEGRSVDTSGDLLTVKDRHGVQCDFCHRAVDQNYVPGVSPLEDEAVLATVNPLPLQYGNGQFINDPAPLRRGPYADAQASHQFVESPFHRSSDMCGICHDVSNPVFIQSAPGDYEPTPFDEQHPDMDSRNMFPIERTYSEWSVSEYATSGVYAPQFAGDKPDGIVSTCQDCHMRDVTGKGAVGGPTRTDIGLHDLMGGNTFVPDIVADFFPDEVDAAQLQAAKDRATSMLQMAARLEVTPTDYGLTVRVINETGHKLPSGYPEGRRIWLHVSAVDAVGAQVFESGAYDFATADLHHDDQIKVYEIHPGLSPGLASALGLPEGPSFHFVLNDTVYSDNRIPPRGFTNAAFTSVQSPPVHCTYDDGQYWDDTSYFLPASAETARVTLYYQTTSKEYVEFLRDANTTNSAGQDLYDSWFASGKSTPVLMADTVVVLEDIGTGVDDIAPSGSPLVFEFAGARPNPFRLHTTLCFSLPVPQRVRLSVFDLAGRRVRVLVDEVREAGRHDVSWDGRDEAGRGLASGIYFVRLQGEERSLTGRIVRVK
jgi:cytochrome c553